MIIGMDQVITSLLIPQQLQREIGHNLIGVHVDGGASTALEEVERELVHAAPLLEDRIAGGNNCVGNIFGENAQFAVCQGSSLFYLNHSPDEFGLIVHAS